MTTLRTAAQQALDYWEQASWGDAVMVDKMDAIRAALAEPTVKESLQVESAFAENATTQQQLEEAPPSDYRRGYWDGFAIGKREGRIEAEDALAEPVQEPVAKVELMTTGGNAGLATRIVEIDDHLRERLRPGQLLYTAPPQNKENT